VRFDDTEIPGVRPTTGYIDLRTTPPAQLSALIAEKLGLADQTAVFIDGDWLLALAAGERVRVDFRAVIGGLRHMFGVETPVCIQLTASHIGPPRQAERRIAELKALGYSVEVAGAGRNPRSGSPGFDVRLALRATDLPASFHTLVLLSGDSDLAPLLEQAKSCGRAAILITCGHRLGMLLRDAADRVIDIREAVPDWSDATAREKRPAPDPARLPDRPAPRGRRR
jgi:hypothetical protein